MIFSHACCRRVLISFFLVQVLSASAGGGFSLLRKLGAFIDSMSVRGVDRSYIDAPREPWQIILKGNVNQSYLKMKTSTTLYDVHINAQPKLQTEPSQYVGLWVGYRGYGLGYTFNVGGDKGGYLTFGATGGSYGVNLRIHSFENDSPKFGLESDILTEEDEASWNDVKLVSPIKVRTLIADGYYLFNGKHFSYSAAYDQSVIQKRSAGSLMAGAMYYYGRIDYADRTNGDLIYLMQGLGKIKLWQASVGVGYAYNWVPARNVLVSAMAMPMLTFVNKIKAYGYTTNVSEMMKDPRFLGQGLTDEEWDAWYYDTISISPAGESSFNSGMTVNVDARLSLTYNFGRYFINAYGQYFNFRYRHNDSYGRLSDWFVNAAFGVRL